LSLLSMEEKARGVPRHSKPAHLLPSLGKKTNRELKPWSVIRTLQSTFQTKASRTQPLSCCPPPQTAILSTVPRMFKNQVRVGSKRLRRKKRSSLGTRVGFMIMTLLVSFGEQHHQGEKGHRIATGDLTLNGFRGRGNRKREIFCPSRGVLLDHVKVTSQLFWETEGGGISELSAHWSPAIHSQN